MATKMNEVNEDILDFSVKKSLGYDPKASAKYSIVPLAHSEYLHPDYDPFKQLEAELMVTTLRKKYGITD
jgi:hypothetical protein